MIVNMNPFEEIPVFAYDMSTGKKVGEFNGFSEAERKLFIRSKGAISTYLFGANKFTFKGKKRGVKSYKTGIRYHFELKK